MNKDNTFSVQKAEDSSGFLLWQVTNLWQREIKKALSPFDHSFTICYSGQHSLVISSKTEVTQIILSQHTKIDPMTTSQVLRALQKKEFISRKEHTTDTRAKTIEITNCRKKIIKKAVIAVENFDREFFSKLENSSTGIQQKLQVY
jgi:DNA-binding MarR family transcriptional regulator